LAERGLECPIDKRMFVDPVKTPCCGKTYCHDCIENALADGDLVCPNCSTDGVLIDDLAADEDMLEKMRAYEAEKAREKSEKEQQVKEEEKAAAKSSSPSNNEENSVPVSTDEKAKTSEITRTGSKSPQPNNSSISQTPNVKSPLTVAANLISTSGGNGSDTDTSTTSKKRKDAPTDIKPPSAPKAMRLQKEQQERLAQDQATALEKNLIKSMDEALKNIPKAMPTMSMSMPMNPMMAMMNPASMNGMPMNNMNPMGQMNAFGNMNGGGWSAYNNGAYANGMPNNMGYGMGFGNNMNGNYGNMGYGGQMNGMQGNIGFQQGWNQGQNAQGFGNAGYPNIFPNQQQPNQQGPYERAPMNPQRHQNKRKQRAPDYHYV